MIPISLGHILIIFKNVFFTWHTAGNVFEFILHQINVFTHSRYVLRFSSAAKGGWWWLRRLHAEVFTNLQTCTCCNSNYKLVQSEDIFILFKLVGGKKEVHHTSSWAGRTRGGGTVYFSLHVSSIAANCSANWNFILKLHHHLWYYCHLAQ